MLVQDMEQIPRRDIPAPGRAVHARGDDLPAIGTEDGGGHLSPMAGNDVERLLKNSLRSRRPARSTGGMPRSPLCLQFCGSYGDSRRESSRVPTGKGTFDGRGCGRAVASVTQDNQRRYNVSYEAEPVNGG